MPNNKLETRIFSGVQLRTAGDKEFALVGVAAPYDTPSGVMPGPNRPFVERIARGAFARALRERQDVRALYNHSPNYVLGRTKSGTLALTDTPEGLAFRCQLDKRNSMHQDIYASVQRRDIDACSFAFAAVGQKWNADYSERTLTDVNLFDVSVVTSPAYPQGTSVDARHLGRYVATKDWRARIEARMRELAPIIAADRAELATSRAEERAAILRGAQLVAEWEKERDELRAEGWDI